MGEERTLNDVVTPEVLAELPKVLLEVTQDLDTAQTLQATLPGWLVEAEAQTLSALEQAHQDSGPLREKVQATLNRLEPLDTFCAERLDAFLAAKGVHGVDVKQDMLELAHRSLTNLNPDLAGPLLVTVTTEKHSLLQAAMQNFSASQAQNGGLSITAMIRSAATGERNTSISAGEFVRHCRELDLGSAYQRHVREVFNLPAPGEQTVAGRYNEVASDIGRLKLLDMRTDLHIALAKGDVSKPMYERLLAMLARNADTHPIEDLLIEGRALTWHGLNMNQACLWSVLVFAGHTGKGLSNGRCVVYMPNEPVRHWFEYETLEDFTGYLSLKLQIPAYREFFKGYLDESERPDFFVGFDRDKRLNLQGLAVNVSVSQSFFEAYVGKAQLDAMVLAVPVVQVDEEARRALLRRYLDAGLTLANIAGFFTPGLGQLMMGVAIGQLLAEVYEGVEDWTHQRKTEALEHLLNVAQGVASMALFMAAGKVVGSLFKRTAEPPAAFFEQFDAVKLSSTQKRLWRNSLRPYRHVPEADMLATPSYRGIYQAHGRAYIAIDGAFYRVSYDPAISRWRVLHPSREAAYSPPLEHNDAGGWRHMGERVDQWRTPTYAFERLSPGVNSLPDGRLAEIITATHCRLHDLRLLVEQNQALPSRLRDSVARWRLDQTIRDLLWQLDYHGQGQPSTARVQMTALPLLDGWPRGRFFELLDESGNLLKRYPDTAPFDYEDLSIHVSEQQLKDGQLTQILLDALSDEERRTLLGADVAPEQLQQRLSVRLLASVKRHYQTLFEQLYRDYDPLAEGSVALLKKRFPQLPTGVAQELLGETSSVDRQLLRNTERVPRRLHARARQALHALVEDRAVAGLYLPPLATAPTERLAIGLLGRLPHWPREIHVQLRAGALDGALLAERAEASTGVLHTLVTSERGYQLFDAQGQALHAPVLGPSGFYQALLGSLSALQRSRLGIYSSGEQGAAQLQAKLRLLVAEARDHVGGYLREPAPEPLAPSQLGCMQAAPPATTLQPRQLIRKVQTLYPMLNEVQASGLIEGLGEDHLARAHVVKLLQLSFEALHRTLDAWRNDRAGLERINEPLVEARLSRKHAAQQLEQCWRRLTGLGEDSRLALDGMRVGALPTLPSVVNFDHVRHLTLKNMDVGDEAAYFLKYFKGLKSLDLSSNRLTRLPEALSHMPHLEALYLDHNNLELTVYTRAKLADLRNLRVLSLAGNRLVDPPPLDHLFDLRRLILRDCRLKTFPEGLWRLPFLETVDLRQNDISRLPDWLFRAPRQRTQAINLRHNPLSSSTLSQLTDYRRQTGTGLGYFEDDIARLNEQAARELWMPDPRLPDYPQKNDLWLMLRDDKDSDGLFKLLAELGGSADTEHVREDMTRRVWRVLEATGQRAELATEVFERAATPINCDDAAALNFSSLEILVEISDASLQIEGGHVSAKALLALGQGLYRLDRLESIARSHSLDNPGTDPLEVSLAYRTGLADMFYLPGQPRHMRYASLSGVTPAQLNAAEATVRAAELTPALLRFLGELPFWQSYLKKIHATRFETLNEPFDTRMREVFDQALDLDSETYRTRMNSVLREQRVAEEIEIERLTRAALEVDKLAVCELP
ncbi:NEL-type E3 ubiquitin ligase domain-containing protein [Pseudomonas spelaei]